MNSTPSIQYLIKTHLQSGNIEYLEPALELGFEKGINPALLKKGFIAVGDHYLSKDLTVLAILSYEKARILVPYHAETVNKLFKVIDKFWENVQEKASKNDLIIFGEHIGELVEFYRTYKGNRFYQPALQIGQRISNRIDELFINAPIKIETPASYSINQIISVKYDYLTPKQREKEYGRIIGKSLRKIIRDNQTPKKK